MNGCCANSTAMLTALDIIEEIARELDDFYLRMDKRSTRNSRSSDSPVRSHRPAR